MLTVKEEHLNLMDKIQEPMNIDHFEVQPQNVDFEITDSRHKCYLSEGKTSEYLFKS